MKVFTHLDVTDRSNALPVAEQTKWNAGLFDIRTDPNTRFFNPSLVKRGDQYWLFARRARNIKGDWMGMNDIVAHLFDRRTKAIRASVGVVFPKHYKEEHYEDPRTMWMGGSLYISCTTFIPRMFTGAHQKIARLNDQFYSGRPLSPIYGGNGGSPLLNEGRHEKNWLWFEHDGRPHMVYRAVPHEVVEFDSFEEFRAVKTHRTRFAHKAWCHGELRGGTPPVRVGDEYWTFFHSSLVWRKPKRQYFMGAYAFSAKPPFEMTRMTFRPLLAGSIADPWAEGLPLVVFPCGAVYENGTWLVTYGVNDYVCGWIEIPHSELESELAYVEPFEEDTQESPAPSPTVLKAVLGTP